MNKKIVIIFLTSILLLPGALLSQSQDAGQPGEFLRYGVGVRPSALGRAYTGFADGANSIYWNPAGLAESYEQMQGINILTVLSNLYGNSTYNYFGISVPIVEFIGLEPNSDLQSELTKWALGVGYLAFNMSGFEQRDKNNQIIEGDFSDKQSALFFSIARRFTLFDQEISLGTTFKRISHNLFGQNASGGSIDIGFMFKPNYKLFSFGLKIQDINEPNLSFAPNGDDIIPMTSKIGFVFYPEKLFSSFSGITLLIDYDIVAPERRTKNWYLGSEFNLSRFINNIPIKFRVGTNSTNEKFSVGFGLDLPQNPFTANTSQYLPEIDWTYTTHDNEALGNNSGQFGLNFEYTRFTSRNFYNFVIDDFKKFQSIKNTKKTIEAKKITEITRTNFPYTKIEKKLTTAKTSRNPGNQSYPLSAQLRLGDLVVIKSSDKREGLINALYYYEEAELLTGYAGEIDEKLNQISYLNYIQGNILKGNYQKAENLCSAEKVWNIHNTRVDYLDQYKYLCDVISFKMKDNKTKYNAGDSTTIYEDLLLFLKAEDYVAEKKYNEALQMYENLLKYQKDKMKSEQTVYILPPQIYIPYFQDGIMVDDILMQMGAIFTEKKELNKALACYNEIVKYYLNTNSALAALQKITNHGSN